MKKLIFTLISIFLIIATSCKDSSTNRLEQVLILAGDNRTELEKVLQYYSRRPEDSLKYQAAVFLISNMLGQYSQDIKTTESYDPLFDHWLRIDKGRGELKSNKTRILDSLIQVYHLQPPLNIFPDINYIKANYLINNIELAFKVWKEQPWGNDISFKVFCEDILPYRVSTEPLEDWRGMILQQYESIYDSLRTSDMDAVAACSFVFESIGEFFFNQHFTNSLPELSYRMIDKLRMGTCKDFAVFGVFVMRALGIPVNWEYTPQWAYRSGGHDWSSVRNREGSYIPFILGEIKPGEPHKTDERMAKAYRHTYGKQQNTLAMIDAKESKPALFNDPCLLDVSKFNFQGSDVEISFRNQSRKYKYVYLAVFDNRNWIPIQWAKSGNRVTFQYMGTDIVYLPVYGDKYQIRPAHVPFILTKEKTVRWLEADTTQKQTLKLYRKYPIMYKWMIEKMKGGKFQGSNLSDFSDTVTLYTIPYYPEMKFHEVILDLPCQYRFYRYLSAPNEYCSIAELEFYGMDENQIFGKIMGTPGSYNNDISRTFEKAFDGNVLTFYDAAVRDSAWVGMDFGFKTTVSKIRYLPRNDDNNIVPGQSYELFFFARQGWSSLGRRVADSDILYYDNVPKNALFLLRNLTTGVEERIFTYENGKQVWW